MKIICIGRNYVEHAEELNNPIPENPVFFLKPDTSLVKNNKPVYYPEFTQELHYEAEIVLKICKKGKYISELFAHKYYDSITIGIDFTARDLQRKCKEKRLPWEIAKAFDSSAPIGTFINVKDLKSAEAIDFALKINNCTVQKGNTSNMIFSPAKIISYLSKFITLKEGDLIFTGTPAGVGAVAIGDRLTGSIEDKNLIDFIVK